MENAPNLSLIVPHEQIELRVFGTNTSQVFPSVSLSKVQEGSLCPTIVEFKGTLQGVA